ncbi:MAG: hydrogenase maturation protease, partial [Candidatus Doudnabacteria bacterium]
MICLGNAFRGDDGAGLEVAKLLRGALPDGVELLEREGEPTGLIDAFEGAEALWLVDAVSSGGAP